VAAAFWSAVPVVLVALPVEGAAVVELALELIEPVALWSAVVEVEGAAEVLLALWSALVAGAAEVLLADWSAVVAGAAAVLLAEVALWSLLVVFEAEGDWQDSETIFTLSTLKLLSGWTETIICTVVPLFQLRSLVLPLRL
jgi:hypothetical protein